MAKLTLMKSNSGFTLVEVMVAIIIMMVGMIGLLQAINVAMEHNIRMQLRTEAVALGQRWVNSLRNGDFSTIASSYATETVPSKVRPNITFNVDRVSSVIGYKIDAPTVVSSRQVTVTVTWQYRGKGYRNEVVSIISRPL